MDYKYNELEYALKIYKDGFQTKHIPTELRLLTIYFRDYLELKPKERKIKLYKFCEENVPSYNRAKHFKIIEKALKQGNNKKNKLIVIDGLDIYKYQVYYINSLSLSDSHKKIMLSLLVHNMLNEIIYNLRNSDVVSQKYNMLFFKGNDKAYKNIKKIANVPEKTKINDDIIFDLSNLFYREITDKTGKLTKINMVDIMHRGLIKLNFIEKCIEGKSMDVAFRIKDFNNVGWYLDYYNNIKGMELCKHCEQPFKRTNKNIKYCSNHKEYYIPIESKTINCVDCGIDVEINACDMKTKRCKECQNSENKKVKLNYYHRTKELKKY